MFIYLQLIALFLYNGFNTKSIKQILEEIYELIVIL